jgi:hypothetical protein
VVIQRGVREGIDGLGNILTGCFDGDIIVVGEVDTSALLGGIVGNTEKFTLQAGVCGTGDVLAVAPLAVSRAFGRTALGAAVGASVSWVSVSIWVKGPTLSFRGSPAVVTIGDIGTTRAEIRGIGISPVATARSVSARSTPRSAKMNIDKKLRFEKCIAKYIPWAVPSTSTSTSTSSRAGGGRSSGTVDVGDHGALTEMGRDVGSAAV